MSAFVVGVAEDDEDTDGSSKSERRRENRQKLSALTSSEYRNSGVGKAGFVAASPMVCRARMRAHTCSLLSLP